MRLSPAPRFRSDRRACATTTRRRVRVAAVALSLTTTAGLVAVPAALGSAPAGAAPQAPTSTSTPPTNPSDGQINAAQTEKAAVAAEVGALGGQIAAAQSQLKVLEGQREFAEQKVALAVSNLRAAQAAAATARAKVTSAQAGVAAAHRRFVEYVQASYIGGGQYGTGSLLTASNPSALLNQSTLQQYEAANKLSAVSTLQRATIVKSNAEASARQAVANLAARTAAAKRAKDAADAAVASEQQQENQLRATLASSQQQLQQAQEKLATLNHQRAQYIAYEKEQARLARIAARKAAREKARRIAERKAALERARRIAARQRRIEQRRQEQQQQHQQHEHQGGNGTPAPPVNAPNGGGHQLKHEAPSVGHWTAAMGMTAVRRARSELGMPYAWAGGGSNGPGYGVCDPSNGAPYDCHVYGFDCSGLAMYAWGPYLSMPHYAASQYWVAGNFHPSASQLRPGDLVFWSYNGAASGIHHVAIYIGGGQIIEAPYSGAYVQVASLWEYGSFFGATRPLT